VNLAIAFGSGLYAIIDEMFWLMYHPAAYNKAENTTFDKPSTI